MSRFINSWLILCSALFSVSCVNTNEQGLLEISLVGNKPSATTQERVRELSREKVGGRASVTIQSIEDKRLYPNRVGAFIENNDFPLWLEETLNSWLLTDQLGEDVFCEIEISKCYFSHVSTSFKAVLVLKITARNAESDVILSSVYRGNEVNLNYMSADSEFAKCMSSAAEEIWLNFLQDLSAKI
ncbi:MAG: hypothetical protein AAGC73_09330 [Verrucomicrobiota bacterium]